MNLYMNTNQIGLLPGLVKLKLCQFQTSFIIVILLKLCCGYAFADELEADTLLLLVLAVSVSCKTTLTAWRFDARLEGRPSHQSL